VDFQVEVEVISLKINYLRRPVNGIKTENLIFAEIGKNKNKNARTTATYPLKDRNSSNPQNFQSILSVIQRAYIILRLNIQILES
jgi:hypothetical protein